MSGTAMAASGCDCGYAKGSTSGLEVSRRWQAAQGGHERT